MRLGSGRLGAQGTKAAEHSGSTGEGYHVCRGKVEDVGNASAIAADLADHLSYQ
jgi:hypothetical protein